MSIRIRAPFKVGDTVRLLYNGSRLKKGTLAKITDVGFDRSDHRIGKSAWRVKISLVGGWWSAAWFSKVKK